jgi:hypothetical protein
MSCISDQTPQISKRYRYERDDESDVGDAVEEVEIDERSIRRRSLFKKIVTILIWALIIYVLYRMFVAWQSSNANAGKPATDVSDWWKKQTAMFRDDPNNPNDLNDRWKRLTGQPPNTSAAAVVTTTPSATAAVTVTAGTNPAMLMQQATLPASTPGFNASPATISAMNAGSPATIVLPLTPTMAATAAAVNANGQSVSFAGPIKSNPYYAEGWGASPYYNAPNWNNAPPAANIATGSGINYDTTTSVKPINWNNPAAAQHPCPAGDCSRGQFPENYNHQKQYSH